MRVSEVISQYITVGCKHFAADTMAERHFVLGKLSESIGHIEMAEAKPIHLLGWLESQVTWKAHTTRMGRTYRILAAFNWAVRVGLCERNPFMEGNGNPYSEFIGSVDPDVGYEGLNDDDFEKLIATCRSVRLKRCMLFLRYTGARPVEMRRLTWDQIDDSNKVIIQTEHKTARKSDGRPRVIHISDEVNGILAAIRREQDETGKHTHVFLNDRGRNWRHRQAWNGSVRRVVKAAGLDCTPYGFGRVAFIERAILANVNSKAIAELVGHKTTTMLELVYARRIGQYGDALRATASQIANSPLAKKTV